MTSKVVIVEGPDGAGKSTLIEKILIPAGYLCMFHNGVYDNPTKAYQNYATQAQMVAELKKGICFDRAHISQAVYGPIMRGELFERFAYQHWSVDARFEDLQTVVVRCCGSHAIHNWEFNNRHKGEYVKKREEMEAIIKRYSEDISLYTNLPCISYDFQTWDIDSDITIVESIEQVRIAHYGDA